MDTTRSAPPADGLDGLAAHWRADLRSGFLVFLIALPLCLGISMASGFPPFAGVLTAVVGGLLVTPVMGAPATIKGPAAGLVVIALGAVEELGRGDNARGYHLALAAVVVAGALQVLFGAMRAGRLGDFFPSSAVHGMLAAIGVIIAAKQVHVALGVAPTAKTPFGLLAEIPRSVAHANAEIAVIGLGSLAILFAWPRVAGRFARYVPGQMVVLLLGIGLGYAFDLGHQHRFASPFGGVQEVGPRALVAVPESLLGVVTRPDFSEVFSPVSLKYVAMFALVGSIESLLSAKAIDTLDPWRRRSDLDRDLVAVGVGNLTAGMLGGLPMIAEIVRSSANLQNGARTRWANFFHGAALLGFVAFAPGFVHRIPLAALAAMLIYTGWRLASPAEFARTWRLGPEQLAVFLTTIAVTLATDLLAGIAAGVALKAAMHLTRGVRPGKMFRASVEVEDANGVVRVTVRGAAVFTNWLAIAPRLAAIPADRDVVVDLGDTALVDHTVLEHLEALRRERAREGGTFRIAGLEGHRRVAPHPLSAHVRPRAAMAR